jgi:ABC-type multidrug transport system fused ATPase/permease subunit
MQTYGVRAIFQGHMICLIISHEQTYLSKMSFMDSVSQFHNSKLVCMVVQDGKHSELIKKNGLYSRLSRRQNDNLE